MKFKGWHHRLKSIQIEYVLWALVLVIAGMFSLLNILDNNERLSPDQKEQVVELADLRDVTPVNAEILETPIFDIVRVTRNGYTVIAGKFQPKATVEVFDGDVSLGSTQADKYGHWVLIPEQGLSVGSHELKIQAYPYKKVDPIWSEQTVLIIVPKGRDLEKQFGNEAVAILRDRRHKDQHGKVLSGKLYLKKKPYKLLDSEDLYGASKDKTGIYLSNRKMSSKVLTQRVSSDFLTFDPEQRVILAGKGPVHQEVRILLNGEIVGTAKVGLNGRWYQKLSMRLGRGEFVFSIYAVAKDGVKMSQTLLPVKIVKSNSSTVKEISLNIPTDKWQYKGNRDFRWIILAL